MILKCIGNPLSPEKPARYAKPDFMINGLVDSEHLGLYDRRLYEYLLAMTIGTLETSGLEGARDGFVAPARALRRAMGEDARRSNQRLRAALDSLSRAGVEIPCVMKNGREASARFPLLSFRALDLDSPTVEWDLDRRLKEAIWEARAFGLIDLETCKKFRCKWSFPLHGLVAQKRKMRDKRVELCLADFGCVFGCTSHALRNAGYLRKHVIDTMTHDYHEATGDVVCVEILGRGKEKRIHIEGAA